MPLGEDQPVVARMVGLVEVVAQMVGQQDGHQVRGRHRGGGVPGARRAARTRTESTRSCCPSSASWSFRMSLLPVFPPARPAGTAGRPRRARADRFERHRPGADQPELDGLPRQHRVQQPVGGDPHPVARHGDQVVAAGDASPRQPGQRDAAAGSRRPARRRGRRRSPGRGACTARGRRGRRRRRCCAPATLPCRRACWAVIGVYSPGRVRSGTAAASPQAKTSGWPGTFEILVDDAAGPRSVGQPESATSGSGRTPTHQISDRVGDELAVVEQHAVGGRLLDGGAQSGPPPRARRSTRSAVRGQPLVEFRAAPGRRCRAAASAAAGRRAARVLPAPARR